MPDNPLWEYARRSARNLGGAVDWLAGGAVAGAEPAMSLYRGDDIDQPLLPTAESGGRSRLGAVASGLLGHTLPAAAPVGALGTFAGRMAATSNKRLYGQATRLEARGTPMEEIRQKTGWAKGPDGEWKWEISDHNAEIRRDKSGDEVLHHPELRRAYPDIIDDLTITREDLGPGVQGKYNPATNHMMLSRSVTDPHEALSVMLHEIQHPIQMREGFSTGASMGMAPIQRITTTEGDAMRTLHQQRLDEYFDEKSKWIAANAHLPKYKAWNLHRMYDEFEKLNPDLSERAAASSDVLTWMDTPMGTQQRLHGTYERAMGEYEAREVQHRMDFTPEVRKLVPPYSHGRAIPQERLIDMRMFPGENGVPITATDPAQIEIGKGMGVLSPETKALIISVLGLGVTGKSAE